MRKREPESERSILVLNATSQLKLFQEHLSKIIDLLGCRGTYLTDWKKAREKLLKADHAYNMVIVDPASNGFRGDQFLKEIVRNEAFRRCRIVLLRNHPEDDLYQMEDSFDVDGAIAKSHAPHEIAFALNRLLFPAQQNRRMHARALATIGVAYSVNGKEIRNDVTVDVSVGGLFLRCYAPESPGQELKLTIHIPNQATPVRCVATAVHTRPAPDGPKAAMMPPGMGISFAEMSSADRSRLFDFITPRMLRSDRRATNRSLKG